MAEKVKRVLKATFPEKCIRCELCVMEAQRQMQKSGLEGSLIRILKDGHSYAVQIDTLVNNLDIQKLKDICPAAVFTVEEGTSEDGLLH